MNALTIVHAVPSTVKSQGGDRDLPIHLFIYSRIYLLYANILLGR